MNEPQGKTEAAGGALPVQPIMCGSCPFRADGKAIKLKPETLLEIVTYVANGTPHICHHAELHQTGGEERACRGARDLQLKVMAARGMIAEPTDDALDTAMAAVGMEPLPRAGK